MTKEAKILARFIRDNRVQLGESQDALAQYMCKGIQTVINWETGSSTPTFNDFCKLLYHFGIDFEYLLYKKENKVDRVMEYFRKNLKYGLDTAHYLIHGSDSEFVDYMKENYPSERIPDTNEILEILANHPDETGYGTFWE